MTIFVVDYCLSLPDETETAMESGDRCFDLCDRLSFARRCDATLRDLYGVYMRR